nr:ribonucleoside-diphosphate reductase subunit alpha [Gammaproteobacteria bacterium]
MAQLLEPTDELSLESPVEFTVHAPGTLKTIKRNGKVAPYDATKIQVALSKAFIAVEGGNAASSDRIHHNLEQLTQQITNAFHRRLPSGGTIHIEDIQDQVELALMRSGDYKVARAYVLYREERRKARDAALKVEPVKSGPTPPLITMPNGDIK